MDLYTFLLVLGGAGLAAMAIQGFGGGHAGGHGHGHAGHGHGGHGHGHSHGGDGHAGHGTSGHSSHGHASHTGGIGRALWTFASPRVLFAICLGTGAFAPLLRHVLGGGPFLFVGALGAGIIFERLIATPIWNFAFRFASNPAVMLESSVDDEATAVTTFDKNGQGLVSIDLDGQVVQLLATLQPDDRLLGAAVRAGDRVRIAGVDSERNRCTVAVI